MPLHTGLTVRPDNTRVWRRPVREPSRNLFSWDVSGPMSPEDREMQRQVRLMTAGNRGSGLLNQNQVLPPGTTGSPVRQTFIPDPDPDITSAIGTFLRRNGTPDGSPPQVRRIPRGKTIQNIISTVSPSSIIAAGLEAANQYPDMTGLAQAADKRLLPGAAVPDIPVVPTAGSDMAGLAQEADGRLLPGEGPQSLIGKIGGFFKRPGISQSMMSAGAAMMSGRDAQGRAYTDPFQSIGAGLQAGIGTYEGLKEQRLLREDKEEEKRILGGDRARRIIAEDLKTSQDAARREAYGKILPIDPETGERGEFDMGAWDDAFATAVEQGDTQFAGVLMQMRPEDPKEIPLGDWNEANGAREDENGDWRKVWYRTGADGNIETRLSEYTVAPPAGARAGGAGGVGGQFQKEEALGLVSLAAINNLVDTGGWMSLAGWVRDDEAFDRLQGQILLDNPDATATQIMEATRSSWSKAEGYGIRIGDDGELQLGDEAAMMLNMVLSDPSGSSEEGDWIPTKYLKAKLQEWSQSNSAGAAYATATAHALQAINPLVRYLSGAQMTNREAMRYYGAVIPSWGDSPQTVNAKMRGLSLLARAMGGDIEAMERVDMSGFVDDPNLTTQKNIEARGEWAQAQLTRVVMEEELSASREANVATARTRQEEDLTLFNPDGTPKDSPTDRFNWWSSNPLTEQPLGTGSVLKPPVGTGSVLR